MVKEYLMENKEINELLDDPLHLQDAKADSGSQEGLVSAGMSDQSGPDFWVMVHARQMVRPFTTRLQGWRVG